MEAPNSSDSLIGCSAALRQSLAEAERLAPSKVSILLEGETGTGKELFARFIHQNSPRRLRSFVAVNCAALSESLVESELFGHEKGAFTGAEEARPGRFERANSGTLLLDEISEMPLKLQAKLLRVLEEEEVERLGGNRPIPFDVRVIASTNRPIDESNLRRDLFHRLGGVHLRIAPLRERREDIEPLAHHFLKQYRAESVHQVAGFATRTLKLLQDYAWPGNVRELRNVVRRACLLSSGPMIQPENVPLLNQESPDILSLPATTIEELERRLILQTLRETGGNRALTAERLGITARTLLNKLKRYLVEAA